MSQEVEMKMLWVEVNRLADDQVHLSNGQDELKVDMREVKTNMKWHTRILSGTLIGVFIIAINVVIQTVVIAGS